MKWSHLLIPPIKTRGGQLLVTLADARKFVLSVPQFLEKPHWQSASRSLLIAAESGLGPDLVKVTKDVQAALLIDGSTSSGDAEQGAARRRTAKAKEGATPAGRAARWASKAKALRA